MNSFAPMLAQSGSDFGASVSDETRNRVLIFLAYAAVILIVAIWAVFLRKQKTKRRRIRRHHPHTWQQTEDTVARHRRRHRGRRHSAELPQNPSLAEARGLPPKRPDDVPPAGA